LLEAGEGDRIGQALAALKAGLAGDDPERIRLLVEDLDRISKPFAGRRMDRSIQRALAGQRLDDVERETEEAVGIEPHLGREG
jgi:molecular chaperone HscA